MEPTKKIKTFGGWIEYYTHDSVAIGSAMNFSLFRPENVDKDAPLLVWLSGLTCNEDNFQIKAGAHKFLAEQGMLLVCPDTSPRGCGYPGEDDSYDFGSGAGFYLNATEEPWNQRYQMESYITQDLLSAVQEVCSFDSKKVGLSGHSMGGHGALTLGLKYPDLFSSISAFSPIVHPMSCPWGEKAFTGYLGSEKSQWNNHDALELLKAKAPHCGILIDQGLDDEFLEGQLGLHFLEDHCKDQDLPIEIRKHPGYDHSYFFIASFIQDHIQFHKSHLA